MALKDASVVTKPDTAHSSHSLMAARSPYEVRQIVLDFSKFTMAAVAQTDVVNLIPLNPTERVIDAFMRVETPTTNGAVTVQLQDGRGGATTVVLAGSDVSAVTQTTYKAAGAGVNAIPTPANQVAGFLQATNTHATIALNNGIVTVYAVIATGF